MAGNKNRRLKIVNAPPCTGKSTLMDALKQFDVALIGMSKLLLASPDIDENDRAGMSRGIFVPCEKVIPVFEQHFRTVTAKKCVIEGFPRTAVQAAALVALATELRWDISVYDIVIEDHAELWKRFEHRRLNEDRQDDDPELFADRLKSFAENKYPVLGHFDHVRVFDGMNVHSTEVAAELAQSFRLRPHNQHSSHGSHHDFRDSLMTGGPHHVGRNHLVGAGGINTNGTHHPHGDPDD